MNLNYQVGDQPVPGFRLERMLGQGGFGQVWQALAPGGAQVALKLIPLDAPQSYKEIRALALVKRIRHPNIMPIVGIWLKDSTGSVLDEVSSKLAHAPAEDNPNRGTMLVGHKETTKQPTELIAAMGLGDKSLHDRLEECKRQGQIGIPLDELLRYMEDSARAIDYLNANQHQLGEGRAAVHHGDIKPKNIMIVGNAAQVGDLGLARVLGDVRSTRLAISAAYAAPEALKGLPPSRSTDQYSLAITYVELRTGELPFEHPDHVSSVMQAHLEGQLDLSRLSLPEQIVIRRATSPEPDARFESAMDMVIALRDAVSDAGRTGALSTSSRRLTDNSATMQIRTPDRFWARVLQSTAAACLVGGMAWVGYALQVRTTAVANANITPVKMESSRAPADEPVREVVAHNTKTVVDQDPFVVETVDDVIDDPATKPLLVVETAEFDNQAAEAQVGPVRFVPLIDRIIAQTAKGVHFAGTLSAAGASGLAIVARLDNRPLANAAAFARAMDTYERAASSGNFEAALAELGSAIEQQPKLPWLLAWRAELLAKMHRPDDALSDLKQASSIDPGYAPAYRQRSAILLASGDFQQASSAASQALIRSPRDAESLENRALAQANLGNLRTALADYDAAVKIDDQRGKLFRLRAVTHLKLSNLDAALADLDRAMGLDEQDTAARRLRALARLAKRDYQSAIEDRQRTAEQAPAVTPVLALRVDRDNALAEVAGKQNKLAKGTSLTLTGVAGDRLLVKFQLGKQQAEGSIAATDVRPFVQF